MIGRMRAATIIAGLFVAITTALLLAPLPSHMLGVWQAKLLDLGHVPLFGVLFLALYAATGPTLLKPLAIAIALAGIAEIIQPTFGRTGDWGDFLNGTLGALSAAAIVRAWRYRRTPISAAFCVALSLGCWVWPIVHLGPYVADTIESYRRFPILAEFASDRELLHWDCSQATLLRTTEAGQPTQPGSAQLNFLPGPDEFSWGALFPVVQDFRGQRWLCCSLRVVGKPMVMLVSFRTGTLDGKSSTHVELQGEYGEGEHTVRLDLVAMTPRARPEALDLSSVRAIQFFVIHPQESRVIVVNRIWLEP